MVNKTRRKVKTRKNKRIKNKRIKNKSRKIIGGCIGNSCREPEPESPDNTIKFTQNHKPLAKPNSTYHVVKSGLLPISKETLAQRLAQRQKEKEAKNLANRQKEKEANLANVYHRPRG